MELIKKLNVIQKELKAPKNQRNNFGNYNYRSCEDILEAVKPLIPEDVMLVIKDEIVLIGSRYYVKATAKIEDADQAIEATAYAREAETKKGMDEAQVTGSASSYARKYALNGLFLIDDTKDADTQDHRPQMAVKPQAKPTPKPQITEEEFKTAIKKMVENQTIKIGTPKETVKNFLEMKYTISKEYEDKIEKEIEEQAFK